MISSTSFTYSTLLQVELPQYEKFSQRTLQGFSACNAEKSPAVPAVGSSSAQRNVRLISKDKEKSIGPEKTSNQSPLTTYLVDCETLSKTDLRNRYKREATAHRNMLSRAKSKGAVIHESFRSFKDFLALVGPMPAKGVTLDRINNADPEYAPGKVRWADKHTQNNNKGDTVTFYSAQRHETYTASLLAKKQLVSPAAIRQRRKRGWTDEEIIRGKSKSLPEAREALNVATVVKDTPSITKPPVHRELTAREIKYRRMAEEFAQTRAEYGTEALPAPLDVLNSVVKPGQPLVTLEEYEHRFKKDFWDDVRPHLNFFNAEPFHQELIERIDPEYVAKVRAQKKRADEMRDQL